MGELNDAWEIKVQGEDEAGFDALRSALIQDERPWPVLLGCNPVSSGCERCGARAAHELFERQAGRAVLPGAWNTPLVRRDQLSKPSTWPAGQRVVVAPHSDLFQEGVPDQLIDQVMKVISDNPQHVFYITTKHAERMRLYCIRQAPRTGRNGRLGFPWPIPNARFGVSCEDRATYQARVPFLFETPVFFRYLLLEPLIQPFDLTRIVMPTRDILWPLKGILQQYLGLDAADKPTWLPLSDPLREFPRLDWVIVGGEFGPRQPHPEWIKVMAKACMGEGIAFNFKGFGDMHPTGRPDRETDRRLVIVSVDGTRRGRGAGSATNFLAPSPDGRDTFFTACNQPDHPLRTYAGGQRFSQVPPYENPKGKMRITDISPTARQLQAMLSGKPFRVDPNAPLTEEHLIKRAQPGPGTSAAFESMVETDVNPK